MQWFSHTKCTLKIFKKWHISKENNSQKKWTQKPMTLWRNFENVVKRIKKMKKMKKKRNQLKMKLLRSTKNSKSCWQIINFWRSVLWFLSTPCCKKRRMMRTLKSLIKFVKASPQNYQTSKDSFRKRKTNLRIWSMIQNRNSLSWKMPSVQKISKAKKMSWPNILTMTSMKKSDKINKSNWFILWKLDRTWKMLSGPMIHIMKTIWQNESMN